MKDEFMMMDGSYKLAEAHRLRVRKIHEEGSKRLLVKSIEKAINTTMIGSLAKFEEAFGILIGFNVPPQNCTEEQLEFRTIWQQVRTDILNNGNKQLKRIREESENYVVSWDDPEAKKIPLK
jgi:hypothetical protein